MVHELDDMDRYMPLDSPFLYCKCTCADTQNDCLGRSFATMCIAHAQHTSTRTSIHLSVDIGRYVTAESPFSRMDIMHFKRCFNLLDRDGNGLLDVSELQSIL